MVICPAVLHNAVSARTDSSSTEMRKRSHSSHETGYTILSCIPEIASGPDVKFMPFSGNVLQDAHISAMLNNVTQYSVQSEDSINTACTT